jgi:hypothetical protein
VAGSVQSTRNSKKAGLSDISSQIFHPGSHLPVETRLQRDRTERLRAQLRQRREENNLSPTTHQAGSEDQLERAKDLESESQPENNSVVSSESSVGLDKLLEDDLEESLIWEGLPFRLTNSPSSQTELASVSEEEEFVSASESEMTNPEKEKRHEKALPMAGSNGAPILERDATPDEVADFIERFEDLVNKHKPSLWDDDNLKELGRALLSYVDSQMKKRFKPGILAAKDWESIKLAIYDLYPQAREIGAGSLANLTRLLSEYSGLSRKRRDGAMNFLRDFKAEAEAVRNSPARNKISDFQLLKWLEGAFEINTRDMVRTRMMLLGKPIRTKNPQAVDKGKQPEGSTQAGPSKVQQPLEVEEFLKNHEGILPYETKNVAPTWKTLRARMEIDWEEFDDWRWFLEEMMVFLGEQSDESLSYPAGRLMEVQDKRVVKRKEQTEITMVQAGLEGQRSDLQNKIDELAAELVTLKDTSSLNNRHWEQTNDNIRKILEVVKGGLNASKSENRSYSGENKKFECYFCGGLHLINDCNELKVYLDKEKIVRINGKIKMPDGSRIPGNQSEVWKKRIDNYYKEAASHMLYVFHGVEDDEDDVDATDSVQRELVALQNKLAKLEKGF